MFCMLWDNYPPIQRNALKSIVNTLKLNLMATIYKAHGEVIEIEPKNGTDFSLSELQAIVSGYIEIISLADGRLIVLNEEGKLHGLAINWNATKIYRESFYTDDFIVGDVLICNDDQIK